MFIFCLIKSYINMILFSPNKMNFSETKNNKIKQKINYLHAFWRLNIQDLDLSLNTHLLLKKLNINTVYDLHVFILKKTPNLFFHRDQCKEIEKMYRLFGLNSPFLFLPDINESS